MFCITLFIRTELLFRLFLDLLPVEANVFYSNNQNALSSCAEQRL